MSQVVESEKDHKQSGMLWFLQPGRRRSRWKGWEERKSSANDWALWFFIIEGADLEARASTADKSPAWVAPLSLYNLFPEDHSEGRSQTFLLRQNGASAGSSAATGPWPHTITLACPAAKDRPRWISALRKTCTPGKVVGKGGDDLDQALHGQAWEWAFKIPAVRIHRGILKDGSRPLIQATLFFSLRYAGN